MSRVIFAAVLLLAAGPLFLVMGQASAATATLGVSPASQTVDDGATFSIAIVQSADVTTTGAQTDISFDASLLQVVSVEKGAAYAGASLIVGTAPQTAAQAIAEANTTGTLQNVTAFYLPGAGSVPAGPTNFVVLSMQARADIGGVSPVTLSGTELLDGDGDPVPVTVGVGEVTVDGPIPTATPVGQTPTPTQAPTPTPSATPEPTPTPEPQAFMKISPPSQAVRPGYSVSVSILQTANFATTGAGADFSFNPALLQITTVERGSAYKKASLIYGEILPNGEEHTGPIAIAEANVTGTLQNIATFFIPGSGSVSTGEATFVKITLTATSAQGLSPITISNMEMLNEGGESLVVAGTNGEVTVDVNAPTPTPLSAAQTPNSLPTAGGALGGGSMWPLLAGLGLLAAAGAVVALWRTRSGFRRS